MGGEATKSAGRRDGRAPIGFRRRRTVIGIALAFLVLSAVLVSMGDGGEPRTVSASARSCMAAGAPGESPCPPAWRSTFSGDWFDEDRWSYWGAEGDPYVGLSIADPRNVGLPRLEGKSARFEVTAENVEEGNLDSKLYKELDVAQGEPGLGISGSYRASFLLPRDYSMNPDLGFQASVNLLQFKDLYRTGTGSEAESQSDPTWWIELRPRAWVDEIARRNRPSNVEWAVPPSLAQSSPDHPIAFVNHWEAENNTRRFKALALPLGRWFEITADVEAGRRIGFSLREQGKGRRVFIGGGDDGADFPVGPCETSPRFEEYCHGRRSTDWIFGVGHYGKNVGSLFSDDASFTPARDRAR